LVPIIEKVLGTQHPDTLAERVGLARWTGEAGDPAGAREQYAALVPIIERVLGIQHPGTQDARARLAYWAAQAEAENPSDTTG
jgi:hypothetical protein